MSDDCAFPGTGRCGTRSGYSSGCRHDDCRTPAVEARRKLRAKRGEGRSLTHFLLDDDTRIRVREQPGAWKDEAACIGVDLSLFFPGQGEDVRAAKKICAGCPVRQDCLRYAMTNEEQWGVWGGKSEKERKAMRGKRRAA